jgi:hypothetical protein
MLGGEEYMVLSADQAEKLSMAIRNLKAEVEVLRQGCS